MNRQFETWLRSGETNLLFLKLERESYIFLRLPKRPGFDYLFAQRQYRGGGALRTDDCTSRALSMRASTTPPTGWSTTPTMP